jgi:hypothetical protein
MMTLALVVLKIVLLLINTRGSPYNYNIENTQHKHTIQCNKIKQDKQKGLFV